MAGKEVRRRFTDVWKMEGGHWVFDCSPGDDCRAFKGELGFQ